MKITHSLLALVCLFSGVLLYPLGLLGSRVAQRHDTYSNFDPWRIDWFHAVIVPLPILIPAALLLAGCLLSIRTGFVIIRTEGVKGLFRLKTIHLWCGALLLIYVIVAYIVVGIGSVLGPS